MRTRLKSEEGASSATSPPSSMISRWGRPHTRLVRFRLHGDGDEQRQLQLQEEEYWKEMRAARRAGHNTEESR